MATLSMAMMVAAGDDGEDALLLAALSPSLALSNYDDGRRRSVDDHGVGGSRRRWAMMGR